MPSDPAASSYEQLPSPDDAATRQLIISYLATHCHCETVHAFFANAGDLSSPLAPSNGTSSNGNGDGLDGEDIIMEEEDAVEPTHSLKKRRSRVMFLDCDMLYQSVEARKRIRDAIINGRIEDSITLIESHFPGALTIDPASPSHSARTVATAFQLQCQRFIEYVRAQRLNDALNFAQEVLSRFRTLVSGDESYLERLSDVCALMAYKNPAESPVAHLLNQEWREKVADEVNQALLAYCGFPTESTLERVVRQATVVRRELSELEAKDKRSEKSQTYHWQLNSFISP
ncbi:uncharacterized protein VTP21DRAFT_9155 [Calcarisporiella thermophila]|uniref:uncharacterized protein n=1 Tax=Calcarisporiella thermophila TaxID=911321 RepID=UPI00374399C1